MQNAEQNTNLDSSLEVKRWFHPITENSVRSILADERIPVGTFLIHPKDRCPNEYLITTKTAKEYSQIKIRCDQKECRYYIGTQLKTMFNSLAELLTNILAKKISIKIDSTQELILKHYLPCYIPANMWYIPERTGFDCNEMLQKSPIQETFAVWHTIDDNYVLGVKRRDMIETINANKTKNGYTLDSNSFFQNIYDLVFYYQRNPLPDKGPSPKKTLPIPFNCSSFYAGMISSRFEQMLLPVPNLGPSKDNFLAEFQEMEQTSKRFTYKYVDGQNPDYAPRNRYKNILPYEHSRVRLYEAQNDYINANYVQAPHQKSPVCYICSQAPIESTIEDHWNMIYQEKITTIVILTNLVEKGVKKCVKYWPDVNQELKLSNGKIIKTESEEEVNDVIDRVCTVTSPSNPVISTVHILQYTAWPDFGTPKDPWGILELIIRCNKLRNSGPATSLLVHCSAGIGRTGAFIAIDIILNQIKQEGLTTVIDVKDTVLKMRCGRGLVVTTVEQYKFIFETLNKYLSWKLGPDPFQI